MEENNLSEQDKKELEELRRLEELESKMSGDRESMLLGPKKVIEAPVESIKAAIAKGINTGSIEEGVSEFSRVFEGIRGAKTQEEIDKIKFESPDMSAALEAKGVSPYIAKPAEFATEVIADPLSLVSAGATKVAAPLIGRWAESKAAQKAGQVIKAEIPESKFAKEGYKISELGKRVQEEGLIGKLGRLDKMREAISGGQKLSTEAIGDVSKIKETGTRGGLIEKYSNDLSELVNRFSDQSDVVSREELMRDVISNKAEKAFSPFDVTEPLSEKALIKTKEILPQLIKADNYTLSQLQETLKSVNRSVKPREFYKDASEDVTAMNDALIGVRDVIRNKIKEKLSNKAITVNGKSIVASDSYDALNNAQHQLMQLQEVLPKTPEYLADKGGLSDVIIPASVGGTVGYGVGSALGSPMIGAGVGAGMVAGRATARYMEEKTPIIMSKLYQTASDIAKSPWKYPVVIGAQKAGRETVNYLNENGRKPQSVEEVSLMKLPRNTEEAIQSPELLLEKVKMLSPQMLPVVKHTIEHEPQKLPDVMFALSQEVPHAFSDDKYGRFDGKIPAASMMKYISDVRDDKSMSNTEKAKLLNQTFVKKVGNYTPEV